jgi:hypothetical protein
MTCTTTVDANQRDEAQHLLNSSQRHQPDPSRAATLAEDEPASGVDPAVINPSDVIHSIAVLQEEQATDTLDEMICPLMPCFGSIAATLQGDITFFS